MRKGFSRLAEAVSPISEADKKRIADREEAEKNKQKNKDKKKHWDGQDVTTLCRQAFKAQRRQWI